MRPPFRRLSDYNFRHGVAAQARRAPELVHRLFAAFGSDGVNEWFAARLERNELSGYIADLEIARELAGSATLAAAKSINLLARYALFHAAIRGIADNVPPALMARLVESATFTAEQATAFGRLSTDPESAFKLIGETLRKTGSAVLAEQWFEAVDVGASIGDADNKVLSLVRFAADMPAHLRKRMLDVIDREPNEGSRSGALCKMSDVPHLDDASRDEIWRIACELQQEHIRSNTMIVLGARRTRSDQEKAITVYTTALAAKVGRRMDNRRIKDDHYGARSIIDDASRYLARYPSEILEAARSRAQDAILFAAFNAALLTQESATIPLPIFEKIRHSDFVVPNVVLERLCSALLRAGRHDDALWCLTEMSDRRSDHRLAALAEALATLRPPKNRPLIAMFEDLPEELQQPVLERIAAHPGASERVMRRLASLPQSAWQVGLLKSTIARILSAREIEALLRGPGDTDKIVLNLAPHLTAVQAQRALVVLDISHQDKRAAVLRRLIEIGHLDTVLFDLRGNASSLDNKTIIGELAPVWPQDRLRELFDAVRPRDTTLRAALFRASLLCHLPQRSVLPLIALLGESFTEPNRLEHLAKLARFDMADGDRDALFDAIEGALGVCLPKIDDARAGNAVQEMIQDLAILRDAKLPTPFVDRLAVAMTEHGIATEQQIRWLATIASGDGGDDARQAAWKAAYDRCVALDSNDVYAGLARRIRPRDAPLLNHVADRIPDGGPLLLFVITAGHRLDAATTDKLVRRIAWITDSHARFAAYSALLPFAGAEVRADIAGQEGARLRNGDFDPFAPVWELLLDAAVPGTLDPAKFEQQVETLDEADRLPVMLYALQLKRLQNWMIRKILDAVGDAQIETKYPILYALAPSLSRDQIAETVSMTSWKEEGSIDVLSALAKTSLAQNSFTGVVACVRAVADRRHRAAVLAPLIPELPLDVLRWCARHASRHEINIRHDDGDTFFDSEDLAALARRSSALGEITLAERFLELLKGGGPNSVGEILSAAPDSHFDAALAIAQALDPFDRVDAVSALLNRHPERATKELLNQVLDDLQDRRSFHADTMARRLEQPLSGLANDELMGLYAKAIRYADRGRQEDILDIMGIFQRPLIAHFGQAAAEGLDAACAMACRHSWR